MEVQMMHIKQLLMLFLALALSVNLVAGEEEDEDEDPYTTTDPKKREPSPCEVCKFFATELRDRLQESAKSKEIIRTGHGLDRKKQFAYKYSELRLTEALHEPHICEKILEYNVHAERKGSLRYAKGKSETMSTLHGLVHKGVKVDLGIPYDMWDNPSAEVTKMERACFMLAERYEDDIENWYYNLQDTDDIIDYLCTRNYLKGKDQACLGEVFVPKGEDSKGDTDSDGERKKKKKKKKKSKKGDVGEVNGPSPATDPIPDSDDPTPDPTDQKVDADSEDRHTEL